jgi:hypothetical protein
LLGGQILLSLTSLRNRETFAAFREIDSQYLGLIVGVATLEEASGAHVDHSIIEDDAARRLRTRESPQQGQGAGARQEEKDRESPLIHIGIFCPERRVA